MKILFLDIDGVLKCKGDKDIDPIKVARLNRITDATGACIVISSTWRSSYTHDLAGMKARMLKYNIKAPVVGMTPDFVTPTDGRILLANGTRADEIRAWLDNDHIAQFIVLDDQDMLGLSDHQVKTDFDTGLQDCHIDQAINLLGTR